MAFPRSPLQIPRKNRAAGVIRGPAGEQMTQHVSRYWPQQAAPPVPQVSPSQQLPLALLTADLAVLWAGVLAHEVPHEVPHWQH